MSGGDAVGSLLDPIWESTSEREGTKAIRAVPSDW